MPRRYRNDGREISVKQQGPSLPPFLSALSPTRFHRCSSLALVERRRLRIRCRRRERRGREPGADGRERQGLRRRRDFPGGIRLRRARLLRSLPHPRRTGGGEGGRQTLT